MRSLVVLMLCCTVGCKSSVPPPTPTQPSSTSLLENHNDARRLGSIPPLQADSRLDYMAQSHAIAMQKSGRMSHDNAGDGTFSQRLRQFGIQASAAGENVAAGYKTESAVMQGWLNSPEHRANILNRSYTHMGAGRAGNYWCVVFARLTRTQAQEPEQYSLPAGIENEGTTRGY